MTNLLPLLDITYDPVKVFVMWQPNTESIPPYVESFRVHDRRVGAAHPLSLDEGQDLADLLSALTDQYAGCLQPTGLLPKNVLYTSPGEMGCAIWHSPAQARQLFFDRRLDIPDGLAHVPPLLWQATRHKVKVFALTTGRRPTETTALHLAPFHNTNSAGEVCMGNVTIEAGEAKSLEQFMSMWEHAFFHSIFTHLNTGESPVTGDLNALWRKQVKTGCPFPLDQLKKSSITLKHLL